jgi:hypothetical protein
MQCFCLATRSKPQTHFISQRSDTLDLMWALEGGCEKVPWKGWNDRV